MIRRWLVSFAEASSPAHRLSRALAFMLLQLSVAFGLDDPGLTLECKSRATSMRAREVIATAEREIRERFPYLRVPATPLRVVVYSTYEDFSKVDPPQRATGFFDQASQGIHALIERNQRQGYSVLAHEYWHWRSQEFSACWPKWVQEGLADHFGGAALSTASDSTGWNPWRARFLRLGWSRLGFEDLIASGDSEFCGAFAFHYYAVAWSFVYWSLDGPESEEFEARLRAYLILQAHDIDSELSAIIAYAGVDFSTVSSRVLEFTSKKGIRSR